MIINISAFNKVSTGSYYITGPSYTYIRVKIFRDPWFVKKELVL